MEHKFNEREFFKSVKKLGGITTYFSSEPTGRHFLEDVIFPHCGCDEFDAYDYMKRLIMDKMPKSRTEIFTLDEWKKFYDFIIKEYRACPKLGEFLSLGVNFFNKIETYENYFRFITQILEIDPEGLMSFFTLHSLGWIKVIDTMVKIADETLGETKKVKKDTECGVKEKVLRSEVESDKSKTEDIPIMEEKGTEPMETIATVDSQPEVVEREEEIGLTVNEVAVPTLPLVTEPMVKKGKVKKTSEKLRDNKGKRGYDISVLQYKRGEKFPDVETASKKTGVTIEEILKSFESKPTTKVDCIWKYANKKKKEVIQYVYLHTFKNQSDIDKSSKVVCGKSINHSNVSPKLKKEWSSITKEEFVWIQIPGIDHAVDLKIEETYKICEEMCVPEIPIPVPIKDRVESSYIIKGGEKVRCIKLNPYSINPGEKYPVIKRVSEDYDKLVSPLEEGKIESAA